MTVITLTKRHPLIVLPGARILSRRHILTADFHGRRTKTSSLILMAAAVIALVAFGGMITLGVRSSMLVVNSRQYDGRIAKLAEENEKLRITALKLSQPEALYKWADMLQFMTADHADYVILSGATDLAKK